MGCWLAPSPVPCPVLQWGPLLFSEHAWSAGGMEDYVGFLLWD